MDPAVREVQRGPRDELLHSARDKDLVRSGEGRDPCSEVDGDTANVVADELTLTGVNTRPHLDTQPAGIEHRLAGALDRARRTVEERQGAVARRLHQPSAKARDHLAHRVEVIFEERAPAAVAKARGALCGTDDVRDVKDRRISPGSITGILHLIGHR